MKTKFLILVAVSMIFAVACKNSTKAPLTEQEKLRSEIIEKEKELFKTKEAKPELANDMIGKYIYFVDKFPKDSLSSEYLFKAAEIAMNFQQPHNAITYLTRIETDYKNFDKYALCIYLKGFVYEYYVGDVEKAKESYTKFIQDYPNDSLVKSAKGSLMFLGLNDEELIDLFQDMNKYKTND